MIDETDGGVWLVDIVEFLRIHGKLWFVFFFFVLPSSYDTVHEKLVALTQDRPTQHALLFFVWCFEYSYAQWTLRLWIWS